MFHVLPVYIVIGEKDFSELEGFLSFGLFPEETGI